MNVFLELRGSGDSPKSPVHAGWAVPEYTGLDNTEEYEWVGLRTDDWIVIDCDSQEAVDAWLQRIGKDSDHTVWRSTPNGVHFYYKRTFANLQVRGGPKFPKTDIKCAVGHQVVFKAPGYGPFHGLLHQAIVFDPAWVPAAETKQEWVGEEWDEMPEGIGDNSMMSFAGTFRRWGMSERMIRICLRMINEQTMTRHPMPGTSIRRLARQAAKYNPEDAKTAMCPHCGGEVEIR